MDHSKKTYRIIIDVRNDNANFVGETCYLTGNFNGWKPEGHLIGSLPKMGETIRTELNSIEEGELELKVTRGDWRTLQTGDHGQLLHPVVAQIPEEKYVLLSVNHWRDEFLRSTASKQVHVMNDSFYFPNLGVHRRVWIYLPKDYEISLNTYPVLYMHDAQHLFDEATSVGRSGPVEWMVDETIDSSERSAIVVAIEHGATYDLRLEEYLIHPFEEITAPKGKLYLKDIVEVLKPYVDQHYRTRAGKESTAMLGSSVGGLLSLHAGLLYPDTFGTVGVFSPSLWMGHDLFNLFNDSRKMYGESMDQQRYYFYAGDRELRRDKARHMSSMSADMQNFVTFFRTICASEVKLDIDPHGKHGALYWQRAFIRFYTWWMDGV